MPFGEYIPLRSLLAPRIPALHQIPSDMVRGTRPGVLRVGPASAGVLMCFEVAYDGLLRDLVDDGADVIVVPTNNATYTGTGQIEQQFAMSRLRAIETGRYVVVASTNGISGIVAPDGHVVERAPSQRRQVVLEQSVAWCTARTPAIVLGPWPELRAVGDLGDRRPGRPAGSDIVGAPERAMGPSTGGTARPMSTTRAADATGSLMVVPTYNERDNLEWIVGRVRARVPAVDVLVVDDGSPDGTGELADALAAADPQVTRAAPHREGRPGRGVPARLPGRPRARLRRGRRDGRRRVPPARAAARPAGRARARRPGHRVALGARRLGRQLAARRARCSRWAATSTPGCCSASRCAT